MPGSTCTSVQSHSELKRIADNANTLSALLSSLVIFPALDLESNLTTCSSIAGELARDLGALCDSFTAGGAA